MATLGYTGTGAGGYWTVSSSAYRVCKTVSAPFSGQIDTIRIYINPRYLSSKIFRLAIYNVNGNLLYADTTNRSFPGDASYAWRTYTLQSTASITAGTSYYLCISGTYSSGYPRIGRLYTGGGTDGGSLSGTIPYPSYKNFSGMGNLAFKASIYITYTPASASDIKAVNGILLANIGDINEVSIDDIKEYGGIDN